MAISSGCAHIGEGLGSYFEVLNRPDLRIFADSFTMRYVVVKGYTIILPENDAFGNEIL
jgi:hypothetical protein